jgi:cytochrome c oxidase subunit II
MSLPFLFGAWFTGDRCRAVVLGHLARRQCTAPSWGPVPGKPVMCDAQDRSDLVRRGAGQMILTGSILVAAFAPAALAPTGGAGARAEGAGEEADLARGHDLFIATGCGACHTIRGTAADGDIGPDLTHLASRRTIAAAMLPLEPETLFQWIRRTQHLKPGARMPSFEMLPRAETEAIVRYLLSLE